MQTVAPQEHTPNLASLMALDKKALVKLVLESRDMHIPLEIFRLGHPLQVLVKYLKDQQGLSVKEIAMRLGRHEQTIWTTYHNAKNVRFPSGKTTTAHAIPLSIFCKKTCSILESLTAYAKEYHQLSLTQIATILDKDTRTIWTCFARYQKKMTKKTTKRSRRNGGRI